MGTNDWPIGLQELGDGCHAYLQPGGGWGWSNAGLITGDGAWQQRWLAPGSIEVVDGDELRAGQLQINLSEGLGRVPGLVVRNRQNYAQDLQISVRGYGARAPFGGRGSR